MTALLDPLWAPPAHDAPRLQKQAYRRMMHTLKEIRTRVPDVLSTPRGASGARVMEAATAALLNPKIPRELRIGALRMLQRRMLQIDPHTPRRLYQTKDGRQNTIAPNFGDELARLTTFEADLHTFITDDLLPAMLAQRTFSGPGSSLLWLGLLEALLVTRLGCCSVALLARITALVGRHPYVCENWAWIDAELSGADGAPQLRRVFLDPVVLAAWITASRYANGLRTAQPDAKPGKRAAFHASLAKQAFKTLIHYLAPAAPTGYVMSLDALCRAEAQRLYTTTMPLLATYAKGEIASSSLHPETWQRLLGCAVKPAAAPAQMASVADPVQRPRESPPAPLPSDAPPQGNDTTEEEAAEGDLDEEGLIANLRAIMASERASWQQGLDVLIERLTPAPETNETARCVVGWLRYLACERKSKGKRLSDGSIHYYRGLLANRLLQHLPPSLHGIGEEELHDAYAEVIRSQTSPGQARHLRMALGAFDRYVRSVEYTALPQTQLLAAGEGTYAISNRIISDAEYRAGLKKIDDQSIVFPSVRVKSQTRAFWVLAFRLGMRRREILGLQARDIDGEFVRVRKNVGRALKTPNAERLLTMWSLSDDERRAVTALARGRSLDAFIFFGQEAPTGQTLDAHPAVAFINSLLERLTGDRHLHPHNLRHSFATLFLLGSLGRDLGCESHPCAGAWIKQCARHAVGMERKIAGALHHRAARGAALGMVMGHGSELTTYEHYVHCLDLLLFMACSHPDRPLREGSAYQRLVADRAAIRALLGHPASYRLPGKNTFAAMPKILKSHRGQLVELRSHKAPRPSALPSAATQSYLVVPPLNALCARPGASDERGCPQLQAERDAAEALLSLVRGIPSVHLDLLLSVLARWVGARMKNSDWASMTAAAAQAWIADVGELGVEFKIDALRVTRGKGGNTKQLGKITRPFDRRLYRRHGARYWLRFSDTGQRAARQRTAQARQRRSRTQSTITWLVCALHDAMGASPPGDANTNQTHARRTS